MIIHKKFFPKIMQDNDVAFLQHLEGVLSSVDELCSVEIVKTPDSYKFRIAPSLPKYSNMLIQEILGLCNKFQIKLNMSKSIKTTAVISFTIELNNEKKDSI